MSIIIKNELDPVFETLGLLSLSCADNWKEDSVKALNDYGVKGEEFFETRFGILEKYVEVFQKHQIDSAKDDFFFRHFSDDTVWLLAAVLVEHREYLDHPEDIDPQRLRSFLAYYITDNGDLSHLPEPKDMPTLPDEKSMIELLDTADVKDEEKWDLLNLLRRPEYYFADLFRLIRDNIPAYEKAKKAVDAPLQKLLKKSASYSDPQFLKIAESYCEDLVLYTSLAMPLLELVIYTYGYQGILCESLATYESSNDFAKETIIRQSKCLSDKSKLDILCALKMSSQYNLELSELLGLSPSTTSHHMNTLLSCGFVTVEKKDGKVYYCLHKENIDRFLSSLQELLL